MFKRMYEHMPDCAFPEPTLCGVTMTKLHALKDAFKEATGEDLTQLSEKEIAVALRVAVRCTK